MILTFVLSFLLNISNPVQIAESNWHLVNDLEKDWIVYDVEKGGYIPFLYELHNDLKSIHFQIVLDEYPGCYLQIRFKDESALFIDNHLVDYIPLGGLKRYNLDSLITAGHETNSFITIHMEGSGYSNFNTQIVSHHSIVGGLSDRDSFHLNLKKRELFRNFLVISFIIIAFSIAVVININSRVFKIYLDLLSALRRSMRDDYLLSTRSINNADILNIVNLALSASFILVVITVLPNFQIANTQITVTKDLMLIWIVFFIANLIWFGLKFFGIQIMTSLFQLKDVHSMHFYEYIRLNNIFMLLVFILFQLGYFVFEISIDTLSSLILSTFTIFVLMRAAILYLKFLNSTSYKKLYLFAYLCTTEILPALISLKMIYSADTVVGF